jgi:hypothetical protein
MKPAQLSNLKVAIIPSIMQQDAKTKNILLKILKIFMSLY